jgi:hypothetical protein
MRIFHKKEAGIVVGKCNSLRLVGLRVLYFERSGSEFSGFQRSRTEF